MNGLSLAPKSGYAKVFQFHFGQGCMVLFWEVSNLGSKWCENVTLSFALPGPGKFEACHQSSKPCWKTRAQSFMGRWDTDIFPPSVEVRLDTSVHGFSMGQAWHPSAVRLRTRIPHGNSDQRCPKFESWAEHQERIPVIQQHPQRKNHHMTRLDTKCQGEWNSSNIDGSSCKNIGWLLAWSMFNSISKVNHTLR